MAARIDHGLLPAMLLVAPAVASAQAAPSPTASGTPVVQPAGQPDRTTGRRNYDAAYFKPYAPATALQMVQRVPGFAIEQVNQDVRGFAQAAGNVVINGQRPSSKSETLQTLLSRIPASRVLRIEVGPGDLYGADFTGKSQVLNLVLVASSGLSSTLEGTVSRDFEGKLRPKGAFSTLLRHGPSSFSASLTIDNDATTEEGYDRLSALPGGQEIEYRRKTNYIDEPVGALAASWDYNGGTNRTAHVNIRAATDRFRLHQVNHVIPVDAAIRDDRLDQRYITDNVELGGDVTRPFAGGGIKLVGLATRRNRDYRDTLVQRAEADFVGGSAQTLRDRLDETLARLTWNRADLAGWNVELGAEGVLNRLSSNVDLVAQGPDGPPVPIELPIAHAIVKERRGEAFVNAGRPLAPNLRLDLGLAYERSRLTVTGDAVSARTLAFWKPKATLDWRVTPKWHAQLSVQRTVAQLAFEDFISTTKLSDGTVNGGNADLRPQRSWESLLTLEHPILGDGLVRLEAGYNRISAVQDRIPTADGFDAPGNLGDGHSYILRTRVEAPLGSLGIKGGRLSAYVSYVPTSVIDPYTGLARPFSSNQALVSETSFRQDLGKIAWGVTAQTATRSTFFRYNELDSSFSGNPYVTAFVEWRPAPGSTLTMTLDNLFSTPGYRDRIFFLPNRTTADPSLHEYRERNKHIVPSITFKRVF